MASGWICPKCSRVYGPNWHECGPCNNSNDIKFNVADSIEKLEAIRGDKDKMIYEKFEKHGDA